MGIEGPNNLAPRKPQNTKAATWSRIAVEALRAVSPSPEPEPKYVGPEIHIASTQMQGSEAKPIEIKDNIVTLDMKAPVKTIEVQDPGVTHAEVEAAPVQNIEIGGPEIKHIDLATEVKHVGDPEL